MMIFFLIAELLLISSSFGFVNQPSNGWINKRHGGICAMPSVASDIDTKRNMFHDYDKPIVLIGYSGNGKELGRLAHAFLLEHFPKHAEKGVIHLPKPGILEDIHNEKYRWPNIIVVDLNHDDEDDLSSTAKSLYESGLLSVYVNVEDLSAEATTRKVRLEQKVMLPYSDFELCIKDEGCRDDNDSDWQHIQWELSRLIARARLAPAVPGATTPTTNTAQLTMGENTFFLSLSFPNISQVQPYVEEMCVDVDAMEYRTDLLDCRDSRFDLLYGMQLLRRYCRNHVVRVPALPFEGRVIDDVMPIVYTVRTKNQAGTYPDDKEGVSKMFDLLQWGLRAGVEVLDVESAWDKDRTNALLSLAEERYASQILGSHHVVGHEVAPDEAVRLFQQCSLEGRAHGAKVVLSIESKEKDRMAHEAALIASSLAQKEGKPVIPNVSLILGDVGRFSRVVNLPFTPVTHESLPFKAAPGQMTASEIMAARVIMKIVQGRRYAILGHNIAYSVSPQMQGAAFEATQLPHQYGRADVEKVEDFVNSDFFKDPLFGGCSVTIPHKQSIIPYVDVMSDAASRIGSVNTLVAKEEFQDDELKRVIYGDNTDWKGIFNPLERQLGGAPEGYALILGAGGTARAAAYAAVQLGLKRIYYNRTPAKAADLAESFGGSVISSLEKEREDCLGLLLSNEGVAAISVRVVISTLPAAAGFVLPDWFLQSSKPVIFDVNYKPYHTKLLEQAKASGCEVVRGSEMLWEQGAGQFELWTQRTAPYAVMKAVVLQNCLPDELLE